MSLGGSQKILLRSFAAARNLRTVNGKSRLAAAFSGSDETFHLLIVPTVTGFSRAQITLKTVPPV